MKRSVTAERLKETEEKFALVARATGQLIYDYDIGSGRIEWGGAVEEVTGFTPEAFPSGVGDWEDMIHPDDRAPTVRILAAARRKGDRFQAEYRFRRRDGGYRRIRDVGIFVRGKGGRVTRMLGTMTDVTERHRGEEALESSLSLLKATLESTADGILVVDRAGKIQTTNQKFIDMWRIPPAVAATGNDAPLLEHVLSQLKDPEAFLAKVKWLYAHPSKENFDVIAFKDGRVFERASKPQRIKTRIIGRVWGFRDVTKRKRAEDIRAAVYRISEIAQTAENLGELFRSIHEIVSSLMPARNFYIAMYDEETRMLSFPYYVDEFDPPPGPEPLGRGLTDYVLRKGKPLLADPAKFLELVKAGEVELIGAPSIDWLGVPLKTQDRTIGAMVVQTYTEGVRYRPEDMDILTYFSSQIAVAIERKRAEEALKISLHEKEVLLKEIHHRVKNNMQVISSLLSLQSRHLEDSKAIGMFKESQHRIRSMALVHEKLYQSKDLSRIDFGQYIQNLVVYLIDSYQVDSGRVRMKVDVRDAALDINTAIPCGLIVNELVTNALKYAFPGGRKGEVRVSLHPGADGRFTLTVGDNGVGWPRGADFRKTDTLGMQLVTMLVDQLDGAIELTSKPGTVFRISFRELKYKPRI
jgi:PAS domain S-box-containing protein